MSLITPEALEDAIDNGLSVVMDDTENRGTICACESEICKFDFDKQLLETDLHIKWDLYEFGADWVPEMPDLEHGLTVLNEKLKGYWQFAGFDVLGEVNLGFYNSDEEPGDGRGMGVVLALLFPRNVEEAAHAIRFILYNDREIWIRKRDDINDSRAVTNTSN